MNLSVNGHSRVPPGFRFHPTEEELLHYYLRKKVANQKIDLDVIPDVDLNKLEPWEIQERCRIGSTPQNDWYFFSHKDKKYPTGTRTNRATAAGFWKATGRDKVIFSNMRRIGMRKTLVFYRGRAPHGQKSDWIMHEYRLDEVDTTGPVTTLHDQSGGGEEGWVVCRVFKKKNYHRSLESPQGSSSTIVSMDSRRMTQCTNKDDDDQNGDVMDQILLYMGNSCKKEDNKYNHQSTAIDNCINNTSSLQFIPNLTMISSGSPDGDVDCQHQAHPKFLHLPRLENMSTSSLLPTGTNHHHQEEGELEEDRSFKSLRQSIDEEVLMFSPDQNTPENMVDHQDSKHQLINDWAALDRLVASQLNGQTTVAPPGHDINNDDFFSFSFDQHDSLQPVNTQCSNKINQTTQVNNNELWTLLRTSSSASGTDPLWHPSI